MMNSHRLLRHAQDQLARGQVEASIETLATLLGADPDHADAHGLLALCLVRRKRLHAARLEAERSVALDPEGVLPHLAAAAVASADRRFDVAESHLQAARSIDPESATVEIQLARLYLFWGRPKDAATHAAHAIALEPDDQDALALAGEVAFHRGEHAEAARYAQAALETDPEHVDSLVLLGHCELAAGNAAAAREHSLWALQLDPTDAGALELMCAIKARESFWLGLWWRFQTFLTSGSGTRTILLLLGMFLVYRVAEILLQDAGRQDIADTLRIAWLAFAAYTRVAPEWFRRTLRKEMDEVRLKPDF
jgi:tetratricopeptide (TPR) repeat protein